MKALIAAFDEDRVIGVDNKLPWHIPQDLAWFKKHTLNTTIIMGRNTWDSLPKKPLPNRNNVVISTTLSEAVGAIIHKTIEDALNDMESNADIFFIGGQRIYNEAVSLVDRMYITHVKGVHSGDAYFPDIPLHTWNIIEEEKYDTHVSRIYVRP